MSVIDEVTQLQRLLLIMALTLPRMLITFFVVPFLSKQVLPVLARNAVIMSFALVILPVVVDNAPNPLPSIWGIVGLLVKEIFIGLLIGYTIAILFWAIESVGFFIDNQRGATMASTLNPLSGEQTSPLGILLNQAVTVIFFTSGGFLMLLNMLYESYRLWPLFSFYPTLSWEGTDFFLAQLDLLMYITVFLAGPIIIIMFLAEFGLGLIGRFAPQLNVFFLAMPVKSALANFVLIIYVAMIVYYFNYQVHQLEPVIHHDLLQNILNQGQPSIHAP